MSEAQCDLAIAILAAGKGTRMKSRRAKVLHEICGRPMLGYSLALAESLKPDRLMVVVGRDADEVQEVFAGRAEFVLQAEQRGTGHAVLQVEPKLRDFRGEVLILYGDTPLLLPETPTRMRELKRATGAGLVLLSAPVKLPGRVVRDQAGQVQRIVEQTDATPEELAIEEGNTGVYLVDSSLLWDSLCQVGDDNHQAEIYLTDVVAYAVREGRGVEALALDGPDESLGVNDRAELAEAARVIRRRTTQRLMAAGVTIVDPEHTYIDVDVEIGRDSLIEPGCVIQGASVLGEGVHLKPCCHIESSRLDDATVVGPSAHLRPGTHLMRGARIGNFVEVKNSNLGPGVKADHLSYIGDTDVGEGSTVACGAITVNYDGRAKHRTTVGEQSFVGCNANLIAPVTLEPHTFVAAGSTITQDVPEDALAVGRARQRNIEGWVARREGRTVARAEPKGRAAARSETEQRRSGAKRGAKAAAGKKTASKKRVASKARAGKKSAKKASAGKASAARRGKSSR
jgi:bifunctional UDP-N-acetylglucosamine pyrophosphorylase/glucosamine-1-phosphate N-acetyltransferase